MRHKGFTLIELLIVIAIIGLLSSIVLGGINVGRTKAKDAVMKENMSVLRTNIEQQFLEQLSYTTLCDVNSVAFDNLLKIANQFGGGAPFTSGPNNGMFGDYWWCAITGSGDFLMVVKVSDTSYYCIDSLGGGYALKQSTTVCTIPGV